MEAVRGHYRQRRVLARTSASVIGTDRLEQNKEQSREERTSGRSYSHGVGERERERLRIVRKEGKYRSISISSADDLGSLHPSLDASSCSLCKMHLDPITSCRHAARDYG
jgi:hypothetical protein